ncbi:MAG: polysaccharide deacetylase family protein [Sphingomonadales bacterium]|nr:polysaccharide deacetylase family protein [Sphingomonadales bacterium]
MTRRLLASIHDVSPLFETQVDMLFARLCRLLGSPRMAMLVVPDFEDKAPLAHSPAYARKLRGWADAGVEMFLHGWCHRDDARKRGFMQKHMTAGAGEFAQLSRDEAVRRLTEGRKIVEDAIGRPVTGFIAPAWLYSRESLDALRDTGFALAEDHLKVWQPTTGRIVAHSPVITWASRTPGRVRSSLMVAAAARAAPWALRNARIAVHPGDTTVPALLDSIDATYGKFVRTHTPARYADLLN